MKVKSLTELMAKAGASFTSPVGEVVFPNGVGVPFWTTSPTSLMSSVNIDAVKSYFASYYGGDAVSKALTGLNNSTNIAKAWKYANGTLVIGKNRAPQGISGLATKLKTLQGKTGADFATALAQVLISLGFVGVNGKGYKFSVINQTPFVPGIVQIRSVTSSNYTTTPVDITTLVGIIPTDMFTYANSFSTYSLFYKAPGGSMV